MHKKGHNALNFDLRGGQKQDSKPFTANVGLPVASSTRVVDFKATDLKF